MDLGEPALHHFPVEGDYTEMSNDQPVLGDGQASQYDAAHQQTTDIELLEAEIKEMVTGISISLDRKSNSIAVSDRNSGQEYQIPRDELAITLADLSIEAQHFMGQFNFNMSLCTLRKAAHYCQAGSVLTEGVQKTIARHQGTS